MKVCITWILTSCKEKKNYCHGWWVFIISICGSWRLIMDFQGSCKVTLGLRVSQSEMFIRQLKSRNDISSFMIQGQVCSPYFLLLRSIFIFYYFFLTCINVLPKYKFLNVSVSFQSGGPLCGLSLKISIMSISSIFMDATDSNLNSGMGRCDQVVELQGQGLQSWFPLATSLRLGLWWARQIHKHCKDYSGERCLYHV